MVAELVYKEEEEEKIMYTYSYQRWGHMSDNLAAHLITPPSIESVLVWSSIAGDSSNELLFLPRGAILSVKPGDVGTGRLARLSLRLMALFRSSNDTGLYSR